MNAVSAVPPFNVMAAALRATTERLALELRDTQSRPPDWSAFEWDVARAVAAIHGISVLLARRLRWRGPPRWTQFLDEQCDHGLRRDAHIGELLARLDPALRAQGTAAIALKGAALRALRIYQAGERPMGDVDLLARPEEMPAVARALESIGYARRASMKRHEVFSDRERTAGHGLGEHADNPLKIELHSHIGDALPATLVDITARLLSPDPQSGLGAYPGKAALLTHLLLHAAGNMRAHALRMVQLHDIALLLPLMQQADWNELLRGHGNTGPWWMLPPLLLTQRYYHRAPPPPVMTVLSRACQTPLRHAARRCDLYEVSWSNLRIAAFPGIAWSRSPAEALRFVKSRLLPSRAARRELALAPLEQPQLATIPWYTRSHTERVLRWLTRRAPRVQTMTCVMAALATSPAHHLE